MMRHCLLRVSPSLQLVYQKGINDVREFEIKRVMADPRVPDRAAAENYVNQIQLGMLATWRDNGMNAADEAWKVVQSYGLGPQSAPRAPQGGDLGRMQAGVQAGGMGGVQGGQGGGRTITYEQMAKMSDKEFESFLSSNKITEDQMDQMELSGGVLSY